MSLSTSSRERLSPGAPTLSFTYKGLGTSRFVFAQLVDDATVGWSATSTPPVPITLDGRQHTIEIPMEAIAHTSYDAGRQSDVADHQLGNGVLELHLVRIGEHLEHQARHPDRRQSLISGVLLSSRCAVSYANALCAP